VLLADNPEGQAAAQVIECLDRCLSEIERHRAQSDRLPPNRLESILSALNMLQLAKQVGEAEGLCNTVPDKADARSCYANGVAYWRRLANGSNDE
jgi:hypothetical protein